MPPAGEGGRRARLVSCIVLFVAAFALYAGTFGNAWLMDDFPVVVNNPGIRSLHAFFAHMDPQRPFRELSYLLDYSLFGLDPRGYHVQDIFWHVLNAWLLFLLILRLKATRVAAWVGALLFLVHPIAVEVVANTAGRKDSLVLAFCLLSLLAYGNATDPARKRFPWLTASLLLWGVALVTKQNAVVLPIVCAAYELAVVPAGSRLLLRSGRLAIGGAMAAVIGGIARIVFLTNDPKFLESVYGAMMKMSSHSVAQWTVGHYFAMVLKSWGFMLGKFIWPASLSMEYTFAVPSSLTDPLVLLAIAGSVALLLALGITYRRSSAAFFGLAWFAVFWIPTSNLFGYFAYFAADRYLYAPSAGLDICAAVAAGALIRKRPYAGAAVVTVLVAILSLLTLRQCRTWKDDLTFYRHMQSVNPRSVTAAVGLANAYRERGRIPEAIAQLEKGIALGGNDPNIYTQLGVIYDDLGDHKRAIGLLSDALALKNDDPFIASNLGVAYENAGMRAEAERMQRKAIALDPDYPKGHFDLGVLLYRRGDKNGALQEFRRAATLDPAYGAALYNQGSVLAELGDYREAEQVLARLQGVDPKMANDLRATLRQARGTGK